MSSNLSKRVWEMSGWPEEQWGVCGSCLPRGPRRSSSSPAERWRRGKKESRRPCGQTLKSAKHEEPAPQLTSELKVLLSKAVNPSQLQARHCYVTNTWSWQLMASKGTSRGQTSRWESFPVKIWKYAPPLPKLKIYIRHAVQTNHDIASKSNNLCLIDIEFPQCSHSPWWRPWPKLWGMLMKIIGHDWKLQGYYTDLEGRQFPPLVFEFREDPDRRRSWYIVHWATVRNRYV